MLDKHVVVFEAEHFHEALEIAVANFQQLISLLSEQLYYVVAILENIKCNYVEFGRGATKLDNALSILATDET